MTSKYFLLNLFTGLFILTGFIAAYTEVGSPLELPLDQLKQISTR